MIEVIKIISVLLLVIFVLPIEASLHGDFSWLNGGVE